jgi:hypothetical protein
MVAVGDFGCDYSSARPAPGKIVAKGGTFVVRYSAGAASVPGNPDHGRNASKLITPDEFAALDAAGLDIIANSEYDKTRVTQGASAGRDDGIADLALWKKCGLARGASIYVSWDATPFRTQWDNVAAYLTAYTEALGGFYGVDMYGGDPVLVEMKRRGLIQFGWRPPAESWNKNKDFFKSRDAAGVRAVSGAHLWQNGHGWFKDGVHYDADEDMILRLPLGSHREALAAGGAPPPPGPPPVTDDVPPWPFPDSDGFFGIITGPILRHGGDTDFDSPAIVADIVNIQQALIRLGFAGPVRAGWADGRYEKPTVAAVKRFQKAHSLTVTGQIHSEDWAVLFSL